MAAKARPRKARPNVEQAPSSAVMLAPSPRLTHRIVVNAVRSVVRGSPAIRVVVSFNAAVEQPLAMEAVSILKTIPNTAAVALLPAPRAICARRALAWPFAARRALVNAAMSVSIRKAMSRIAASAVPLVQAPPMPVFKARVSLKHLHPRSTR